MPSTSPIVTALVFIVFACSNLRADNLPLARLEVESRTGVHEFQVEVASTDKDRATGLMFRKELAPDSGMLFVYQSPQTSSMWMKNTALPLDMLFIRENGTIARIESDTVPHSLARISSGEPVTHVLELPAGTAKRLGIKVGDVMEVFPLN